MQMKVAYCTGFWCTNIGNGFFSLGVEYVLRKVFGAENVIVVSDYQTYTNAIGKRLYPDKKQLEYIADLDVDMVVLAGPVLSRYFLLLWKDTLLKLQAKGVRYMLLSTGIMKLNNQETDEMRIFFKQCPPYLLMSRERKTFDMFADQCDNAYDGICFSFFTPEVNPKVAITSRTPYLVMNFDKIGEPKLWCGNTSNKKADRFFMLNGQEFHLKYPAFYADHALKTDRFTDALVYVMSLLPPGHRADEVGGYNIIRTDHRFHPHYRRKIYRYNNSFVSDIPHPYLVLYSNSTCTLSDRVHACAVTMAYGNSAMLFAKTNRVGLLERVGANEVCHSVVKLDLQRLAKEKEGVVAYLENIARGK